jgi:hypothetical protein
MNVRRLVLAFALSAASCALAAEVQTGDSLAEVKNTLGAPRGEVKLEDRQVLYYERGEVELQDQSVTRVALRTPEEQAALDAREERQRGERDVRRNQLVAEGTALRDSKLNDPAFHEAPLAYQISFWETFAASYPGVSCLEPLTIARMRFNEQQAQQRHHDEQAARIAELETQLASINNPSSSDSAYYGGYGYGGYGGYHGGHGYSYNPPSFGRIKYDFWSSSPAPYATPHGSPYTTPSGSPYTTPSGSPYTTPSGSPYATPSSMTNSMNSFPSYDQPSFRLDRSDRGSRGRGDRF